MDYLDARKVDFDGKNLSYDGKKVPLNDISYVYISGYYSGLEYYQNLDAYSVYLKNGNDTYILLETQDRGYAKSFLKGIKKIAPNGKDLKLYNNALVDLKHVKDVRIHSRDEKNNKVHLIVDNNRILRVYKSTFKMPVRVCANSIKRDLEFYKALNSGYKM